MYSNYHLGIGGQFGFHFYCCCIASAIYAERFVSIFFFGVERCFALNSPASKLFNNWRLLNCEAGN